VRELLTRRRTRVCVERTVDCVSAWQWLFVGGVCVRRFVEVVVMVVQSGCCAERGRVAHSHSVLVCLVELVVRLRVVCDRLKALAAAVMSQLGVLTSVLCARCACCIGR